MAVFRVAKNKNFTTMSNVHLRDKDLSLKAKGLLSMFLSLPDEWHYSISGIVSICKENETAVTSAIKELKRYGYLEVRKKLANETESRRLEYEYIVYETPHLQGIENQGTGNQCLEDLYHEDPDIEVQDPENQEQLNTEETNTERSNTEEVNTEHVKRIRHKYGEYQNVYLSDEDMQKLMQEFPQDYEERISRLSNYIACKGTKYANHLAVIRSWARKEGKKMKPVYDYSFEFGKDGY